MMALCRFCLWSNQGMIMLSTCASRTIHIYLTFSDYYSIEKNNISALWGNLAHHLSGQIIASLLSLCIAKWLRKWRWGWLYVRWNTKKRKVFNIIYITHWYITFSHLEEIGKSSWFPVWFLQPRNGHVNVHTVKKQPETNEWGGAALYRGKLVQVYWLPAYPGCI